MSHVLKQSFFKRVFFGGLLFFCFSFSSNSSHAANFSISLTPTATNVAPNQSVDIKWQIWWVGNTPSFPLNCTSSHFSSFSVNQNSNGFLESTVTVTPSTTTTYTLACTGQDGQQASAAVEIVVSNTPTVSVWTNVANLDVPGAVVVSWSVGAATSCTPSGGGTSNWTGVAGTETGGTLIFTISGPTTFVLTCSNASGASASDSATVTIGGTPPPPPPDSTNHCGNYKFEPELEQCDSELAGPDALGPCPSVCSKTCTLNNCPVSNPTGYLTASKSVILKGETVTLTWNVEKGGQPYSCNMVSNDPNWNDGDSAPASGSRTFVPTMGGANNPGIYNYTLCSSVINTPFFFVQIKVVDPPVLSKFEASLNPIDIGQSSVLSWEVANASAGCNLFDGDTNSSAHLVWSGDGTTTTQKTVSPTTTTDYTLKCGNNIINATNNIVGVDWVEKKLRLTVTGTPDPCTPDNSCAATTCVGYTCSDKCGGTISGTSSAATCTKVETSPTSSTTCAQGSCKGACNTATETPSGTCNSNLGFCCVPKTTTPVVLTSTPWSNPVAFNTVEGLLDKILSYLQGIIVILSLIMIVIGSIIYMTAAGNDSKLSTGKLMITASLVGLALALAAPSFLKEIGEILGWTSTNVTNVQGAKTLLEILQTALNFLLSVIGIIGIIMLVVGGIMYLTAAGNEDRLKTGKAIVTYSLIGIAVALAALVIVTQVIGFFS